MNFQTADPTFFQRLFRVRLWSIQWIERPAVILHFNNPLSLLPREPNDVEVLSAIVVGVGDDVSQNLVQRKVRVAQDLLLYLMALPEIIYHACQPLNLREAVFKLDGDSFAHDSPVVRKYFKAGHDVFSMEPLWRNEA